MYTKPLYILIRSFHWTLFVCKFPTQKVHSFVYNYFTTNNERKVTIINTYNWLFVHLSPYFFWINRFAGVKFKHGKNQSHFHYLSTIQECQHECIPVGCVLAARRPYAGVCFGGGGGGVPGPGGVGVSGLGGCAWSGGVVCLVWGVGGLVYLVQRGCVWSRGDGVSGPGGVSGLGGLPQCLVGYHPPRTRHTTPPWTEWQTGVKILPWPQLRCGR